MSVTDPIQDTYIDSVIKSAELDSPNTGKTAGKDLRVLLKLMRDYMQQQLSNDIFDILLPNSSGVVIVNGGVEQVTATRDLVLDVADRTPGKFGTLMVLQDTIGLHSVSLAPLNMGLFTPIEIAPNTVTKVTWENLNTFTAWTAEVVVGPTTTPAPSAVTDLAVTLVDAAFVQLTFTSPIVTNNVSTPGDKYHLYISQTAITPTTNLSFLKEYTQFKIPAKPGTPEFFNLNEVEPKTVYYAAITVEKNIYGKIYVSPVSNIVTFTTLSLDASDNVSGQDITIPVDPDAMYTYHTAFATDTDGTILDQRWLVDYTNISVTNGTPSGYGNRSMEMVHTDNYVATFYNASQVIVFDLDGIWTVDTIWTYTDQYGSDLIFQTSPDGNTWVDAVTIPTGALGINQWNSGTVAAGANSNVRYIRLTFAYIVTLRNVLFRGVRSQAQAITGTKYKRGAAKLNLADLIGTNSFAIEPVNKITDVAKIVRFYHDTDWFTSPADPTMAQGGSATPVTQAFVFQGSRLTDQNEVSVDFDVAYQSYTNAGIDILFCLVTMPLWLSDNTITANTASTRKPLDRGVAMTLDNTTNPQNYKTIASFYWNIAARYGSTTGQDTSHFRLYAGQTQKSGLNLIKYIEIGQNECDLAYPDQLRYTNPQELAAMMSAIYDGHKGALGDGYGVKNADPHMVCAMPGLSGTQVGYVEAMYKWWDVNRGVGDYPMDMVNQHWYNTSIGSQNINGLYDLFSYPPEMGVFANYAKSFIQKRDSNILRQYMEFWISETGYDEHYGSAYSPSGTDPAVRGRKKGMWNVRNFLVADWLGIDKLMIYAFEGTILLSQFSNSTQNIYEGFATAGYFDGPPGLLNKNPLTSYYYATAFKAAVQGYKFSHAVRVYGAVETLDTIIYEFDPYLFVTAYQPVDPSQKGMLVLWLGDDQLRTINATLRVAASESIVSSMYFDDLYTSHALTGTAASYNSIADGDQRKIMITVSNTPTLYFTNNLGIPTLIDPQRINLQSPSSTSVMITWTDQNIGLNTTKIYRGTSESGTFVQIYSGYIDNGQYLDTGLAENTDYFYKLQFASGTVTSNLTTATGVTTFRTIAIPNGFAAPVYNTSSIELIWSYGANDIAYISNFELWRSNSAAGEYVKIATLPQATTSYTDSGLPTSTTYYYKLRAVKGFVTGAFTLVVSQTTNDASASAPVLQSIQTNYTGDKIVLTYNLPISDPSGNESKYTVIEGTSTLHNITLVQISPVNNTKIYLYLDTAVSNPAATIKLGYDGTTGTIQSIYNIKAASFSNQSVTIRTGDTSLLSRTIEINITNAANESPAGSNWNNIVIDPNNIVQTITGVLYDSTEAVVPYNFLIPINYPGSFIAGVASDPSFASSADSINSLFPVESRLAGIIVQNYFSGVEFGLLKVDTTKEYNFKVFGTYYSNGDPGLMSIVPNGITGKAITLNTGANKSQFAYLTSLQPSVQTLDIAAGSQPIDGYTLPMVSIKCSAVNSYGTVMAIIIEEVIPG